VLGKAVITGFLQLVVIAQSAAHFANPLAGGSGRRHGRWGARSARNHPVTSSQKPSGDTAAPLACPEKTAVAMFAIILHFRSVG
jgi:hypothetical protein